MQDRLFHVRPDAPVAAAISAPANGLEQLLGRDAGFRPQGQPLGDYLLDDQRDLVVDQLGNLTRADFTDIRDLVADAEQGRLDLFEDVGV